MQPAKGGSAVKGLLSLVRAKRALTISVAALLVVSLVGIAIWRQVGARADAARTSMTLVSAASDPWTDDTGATGSSALTYGHTGCGAVDGNGICTGGAWTQVSIPGAHWIWETQLVQANQQGHPATFSKIFSIPPNASAIAGQLQITADNAFDVQVNGTEIGSGHDWTHIFSFDIASALRSGQNTITATVTNDGGFDAGGNPAGLYYSATVSFATDSTTPTTTASINGQTGLNGWYRGPVTVTLAATDPDDAASALTTSYSLDGSAPSMAYSSALTLSQDGKYILQYQSSDPAGNAEATLTNNINIDQTPPALNISGAPSGTYDICAGTRPSRPTYAPADSMSGLDGSQGESWTTPTAAAGVGTYNYAAHAADMAGNSAQDTRTYTVQYGTAYTTPSLPHSDEDANGLILVGHHLFVWFQLLCNGTPITNAGATLTVTPGSDATAGKAAAARGRRNRNTDVFQYVSELKAYVLDVWTMQTYTNPDGSVVNFGAGTYTLTVSLDDGSLHTYTVQLSSGGRQRWLDDD
jgi:hypothetical protein